MKRCYVPKKFKPESMAQIAIANDIVSKYLGMGLRLTLRQLYYQFVAHHERPNTERSYQNLSVLISDARLAGLLDWNAIEDRGRVADVPQEWESLPSFVEACIGSFRLPRWDGQSSYVELWVEKQALAGVLEPVASRNHVTLMVNKGYSSQSAMYASAQRFLRHRDAVQQNVLLYLGDLDPSGEDMVRDIRDRLTLFGVRNLTVTKVALTMDQVDTYGPPPQPAKSTDARFAAFQEKHGDESWEVDSLDPSVLVELIQEHIDQHLVQAVMDEYIEREDAQKAKLRSYLKKMG